MAARSSIIWRTTRCRSASSSASTTGIPICRPFEEFQRFKTHPAVRPLFEGGRRIAYGARALTEGGFQSIPKLVFPGRRADRRHRRLPQRAEDQGQPHGDEDPACSRPKRVRGAGRRRASGELDAYPAALRRAGSGTSCTRVRNIRAGVPIWGLCGGAGLFGARHLSVARQRALDAASQARSLTAEAGGQDATPIDYPKPDGVITFDRLSSVFLSNTNHEENQPVHLQLKDPSVAIAINLAHL